MSLKKIVKPFIPIGVYDITTKIRASRIQEADDLRRKKMAGLRGSVAETVKSIRSLASDQRRDVAFLERTFVPSLGLNNEMLHEQPAELTEYFGKGLHIWQYPSQLARYLAWLSENGKDTKCYLEIGCRWGGMFILVTEWLRASGADIRTIAAVDPIDPSPFIQEYLEILEQEATGPNKIEAIYLQEFSTSDNAKSLVERIKADFVFIDGDHSLAGALSDHLLIRDYADVVVHHDIASQACPDVALLWRALKALERDKYKFLEFTDQYHSVDGNFLGIGVMKKV